MRHQPALGRQRLQMPEAMPLSSASLENRQGPGADSPLRLLAACGGRVSLRYFCAGTQVASSSDVVELAKGKRNRGRVSLSHPGGGGRTQNNTDYTGLYYHTYISNGSFADGNLGVTFAHTYVF